MTNAEQGRGDSSPDVCAEVSRQSLGKGHFPISCRSLFFASTASARTLSLSFVPSLLSLLSHPREISRCLASMWRMDRRISNSGFQRTNPLRRHTRHAPPDAAWCCHILCKSKGVGCALSISLHVLTYGRDDGTNLKTSNYGSLYLWCFEAKVASQKALLAKAESQEGPAMPCLCALTV